MQLKEIYKRAKKINPFYKNSFSDFIQDFGNCTEDFFISFKEFKNCLKNEKLWKEWNKYYIQYYKPERRK